MHSFFFFSFYYGIVCQKACNVATKHNVMAVTCSVVWQAERQRYLKHRKNEHELTHRISVNGLMSVGTDLRSAPVQFVQRRNDAMAEHVHPAGHSNTQQKDDRHELR